MVDFPYRIVRTKRKTLSIRILSDKTVEVRCPLFTTDQQISSMLQAHKHWIEQKQREMSNCPRFHGKIEEEKELFYLGNAYTIHFANIKVPFWDGKSFFLPEAKKDLSSKIMEAWYKQQAKILLTERVKYYAKNHGFRYQNIRISSASKRYGSCSVKNSLSFTWKLIFLPLDLIDYVVVHELAHTKEKHHQKKFWKLVESILPDYKEREKRLKQMPFSSYWF